MEANLSGSFDHSNEFGGSRHGHGSMNSLPVRAVLPPLWCN